MVIAAAENGVIGRDNELPWHLPADLKRFKALTMGKPMLMGRKTFESIGKPLPGRTSVVLTRSADWRREGVITVGSVEEAIQRVGDVPELVVIGGAEVFRLALPYTQRIHLTRVHADLSGDIKIPPLDPEEWREVERSSHPADERHAYAMTFVTLERTS
jgi:dihydrofolate reductase